MTARRDKNLPIAIAGSFVVHVLLFMFVAWLFSTTTRMAMDRFSLPVPPQKKITLLFPAQIIVPPPPIVLPVVPVVPAPPKKEIYIRTTQNDAAPDKPKAAAFVSDRNTTASSIKAAAPDGKEPMPTTDGIAIPMRELANRDYRDGTIKEDAAKTSPGSPGMIAPPPTPPSQPPAPPPQPVQPQIVAKAKPETTPLTRMMEEADKELARTDLNRLPLEIRKPTPMEPPTKVPDAPPVTPPKPQMRETADTPPKAIPVSDPVLKTTSRPEDDAFMPFTRTSEAKGTISNRGTTDAVDAEETPKGRYIRQVTGQVEKKWHLYRVLKRDSVTYGSLKVEFFVNKKGKVEDLRIVNDRESNPLLSEFTIRAIRDAEIPPIPKDVTPLLPMHDKERLRVEYNVLIY